jgi:hypothetical protein
MELPNWFNKRMVRRICRNLIKIEFDSLRHQVSVLATTIRQNMSIDITDTELSQLFVHSGGMAQETIARYMHPIDSGNILARYRRRLVESKKRKSFNSASQDKPRNDQRQSKTPSMLCGSLGLNQQILGKPFYGA